MNNRVRDSLSYEGLVVTVAKTVINSVFDDKDIPQGVRDAMCMAMFEMLECSLDEYPQEMHEYIEDANLKGRLLYDRMNLLFPITIKLRHDIKKGEFDKNSMKWAMGEIMKLIVQDTTGI